MKTLALPYLLHGLEFTLITNNWRNQHIIFSQEYSHGYYRELERMQSNIDHNFDATCNYIPLCKGIISSEEINEFLPRCRLHTEIMVWKYNSYGILFYKNNLSIYLRWFLLRFIPHYFIFFRMLDERLMHLISWINLVLNTAFFLLQRLVYYWWFDPRPNGGTVPFLAGIFQFLGNTLIIKVTPMHFFKVAS